MKLIYKYKLNLDKKQSKILMELMKDNYSLFKKIYKENNNNDNIVYEELFDKYKYDVCAKKLDYSLYKGCLKSIINKIVKKDKSILVPLVFEKEGIFIDNNILKLRLNRNLQIKYNINNLKIKLEDKNLISNILNINNKEENIHISSQKNFKNINIKNNYNQIEKVSIIMQNTYQFIITIKYVDKELSREDNNIVAIDLGVSNLAACTNLKTDDTILINGGPLKSMNRYINNKIAKLQIIEYKRLRSEYKKRKIECNIDREIVNTKQIKKLQTYRQNYINTYMQKSANEIIKYAIKNKANVIVIGYVKDIEQTNRYADNFIPVPIQELEKELWKRGKKNNIEIRKVSESYTSGCSSLDLELINKYNYNKDRRVVRGLFKSNTGIYINSDINGSLNILRKYIDKKYLVQRYKKNYIKPVPNIIKTSINQGYIKNPKKINVV